MKKIISIFMCFALLFAFSACSSSEQTQQDDTQTQQTDETVSETQTETETGTQSEDGKILVVYYSATGNTKTIASYIAEAREPIFLSLNRSINTVMMIWTGQTATAECHMNMQTRMKEMSSLCRQALTIGTHTTLCLLAIRYGGGLPLGL